MIPSNVDESGFVLTINFRSQTHERLQPLTTNDFPSVQYSAPASSAFRISAHSTYGSIHLMDEAFHFGVGAATTYFGLQQCCDIASGLGLLAPHAVRSFAILDAPCMAVVRDRLRRLDCTRRAVLSRQHTQNFRHDEWLCDTNFSFLSREDDRVYRASNAHRRSSVFIRGHCKK